MAKSPINTRLEKAVALHQAGDFAGAERLYDQVLALDRTNPDALNLKGVIADNMGRHAEAIELFDRAIKALPQFADARFNRALALTALGRNDDALLSYADAIRLKPGYADARLNFGRLLHTLGRTSDAAAAFRAMIHTAPRDARGYYNLGVSLEKSLAVAEENTRSAIANEARAAFTRASELDPKNADVHFAFANLHAALGEYGLAAERLKSALALNPNWSDDFKAEALSDLGEYLRKEGQYNEAVATHRQAAALRPAHNLIKYNLAAALADSELPEQAGAIYEALIASDPSFAKPYVNLASLYRDASRLDEALNLLETALSIEPSFEAYSCLGAVLTDKGWLVTSLMIHDKAVGLKSDDAKARFNRAIPLLAMGHLARGWPDYDKRFEIRAEKCPPRPTPPPYWQGEDISDKTIFIYTEQGIGDEVLYASMFGEMIRRAKHCIIETSPRLPPVIQRSFPTAEVVPRITLEIALAVAAKADVQISAASLGQYLRRDFASFPKHTGYLKADPEKRMALRRKYEGLARGRRIVGIAWKSKQQVFGRSKSTTLTSLRAILEVPGIMFVNLQYGDCSTEIEEARALLGVEIYQDPEIDSLSDIDAFFTQVAAMDLVISTSNSGVHVAGSLNVPTWMLLPSARGALWYWFLRREDSPWYPSLRIMRGSGTDPDHPWEQETSLRAAADLALWTQQPRADR